MAKAKKEEKKEEKIYTIPLKKEWLKTPRHKRAKKAMKAIKEFMVRHMKVPDRDINKVKIDRWINEAVWLRGIKKPPQKIIVKAIKDSEGNVKVEFQGLPPGFKVEEEKLKKKIEKTRTREKKKEEEKKKKKEVKKKKEPEEKTEEEKKEEEERKEKEKALHKEISTMKKKPKFIEKPKQPQPVIQRKALEK
ncbi:MAG: 50S ribosomal protein L31e [Candidatus Pacearchaeota archaeon]|nr:MAG: 50S ribosomal protein L31e [Candidatus Pacearchaeota archaeon]